MSYSISPWCMQLVSHAVHSRQCALTSLRGCRWRQRQPDLAHHPGRPQSEAQCLALQWADPAWQNACLEQNTLASMLSIGFI